MRPIICLTPIKNEEWILAKFLAAASQWSDHIVIADQQSTDRSVEIAKSFPKVTLVENSNDNYDEVGRQKLLLDAARSISSESLLVALDADEFLSGNVFKSPEWNTLRNSPPGTTGWFQWQNVLPDVRRISPAESLPFAYVDDGREHSGKKLHSRRIPTAPEADNLYLQQVSILHYHYVDWDKMLSKIRFYQCLERINHPQKSTIQLYRFYHKWQLLAQNTYPIPSNWINEYAQRGVDLTSVIRKGGKYWDEQVYTLLDKYGSDYFADIPIWNKNWIAYAQAMGHSDPEKFQDPRSWWQRKLHSYLFRTQSIKNRWLVKSIDKALVKSKF